MKYLIVFAIIFISTPLNTARGQESCKVVNGYNLFDYAKIIAKNEGKDIGKRNFDEEYILKDAYAENMRVIKLFENIKTKAEIYEILNQGIVDNQPTTLTVHDLDNEVKKRSTAVICSAYEKDEFVNDGGSFLLDFQYKDGGIFHSVLVEKDYCGNPRGEPRD